MQHETGVLVVEDEALVSEMLCGLLEDMGYVVVGRAVDGAQAIEMTVQLAGTSRQPDVILMDIEMPGVDGIEAARQIYDRCPTPVVVLTAYETPELVERASAAGVGAYLTKLPSERELDRTIAIAMARFGDLMELRRLNAELRARNEELEEALTKVKTLSGLLPICANCKKVRDDKGYWHQVEVYIRDHSEAKFSHGICPDCARELYPEFYGDNK